MVEDNVCITFNLLVKKRREAPSGFAVAFQIWGFNDPQLRIFGVTIKPL